MQNRYFSASTGNGIGLGGQLRGLIQRAGGAARELLHLMPPLPTRDPFAIDALGSDLADAAKSCLRTLGFGCYKPPLKIMPVLHENESAFDGVRRLGNGGRTWARWQFVDDGHPADWDKLGVHDPILRDLLKLQHPGKELGELAAMLLRLMTRGQLE